MPQKEAAEPREIWQLLGRLAWDAVHKAQQAVSEQLSLLRMMLHRSELFVPMAAIWVASFGGALHAPVTTYYLQEVGATTAMLGNFGIITTVGSLVVTPFYGWLLDTRSAYLPALLSAFCCSFGCLTRGFAPVGSKEFLYGSHIILGLGASSFWNVVSSHVALATPLDMRSLAVSGFQVQEKTLRLLGTSLYPLVDWTMVQAGVLERLLRYRIHMSYCSIFCVFGFFYMVVRFRPGPRGNRETDAREAEKVPEQQVGRIQLLALMLMLMIQSLGETIVTVLWPLHVRTLGWDSHEYAWLQVASQIMGILGTMSYPALCRRCGHHVTASSLPMLAGLACAAAFLRQDNSYSGLATHVFSGLVFFCMSSIMKVCYQHLVTVSAPPHLQGRTFSLLSILISIGNAAGHWLGTRLHEYESSLALKGSAPFLLTAGLLLAWGSVLAASLYP